ncbi:MAG: hypothetical protein IJ092_01680, partial [Atopobiaceae bacterium]|nr:hypothetical protein [Atopobiaceae bacterium]
AALMYWFGKAQGFNINIYPGRVSNSDHGWNELVYNGTTYVIDTEMNCSVQYPELNWFMVRYSEARIRYYDNNMNRVLK